MRTNGRPTFAGALKRYKRARAALERAYSDNAVSRVDVALDALLVTTSRSPVDVGTKLSILRDEYGLEVQPRHAASLYGDIPMLERYSGVC